MKRFILEKLKSWQSSANRKPLILRGARQVGKTYVLKEFGQNCFPNYHYINFEKNKLIHKAFKENFEPNKILDLISLEINQKIAEDDLIIFDEIQELPEALTSLKYFAEDLPKQAICAAGSLLGLKFNDLSFPVGKVDYLDMFPMNFYEFLNGVQRMDLLEYIDKPLEEIDSIPELVHEKLWQELKNYFVTGGLPEVVERYRVNNNSSLEKFNEVRLVQKQILSSYLDDMAKHSGKENSMNLERLFRNIPEQLAKNIDASTEKFRFKSIIPGVSAYSRLSGLIDWLEAVGLIIKVKIVHRAEIPFSAFTKENRFKLFVFDIGLLGALSELNPKYILDFNFSNYKGFFAENFVAQEFRVKLGINNGLYTWTEGQAEIEFLMDLDAKVVPIEVKSGLNLKAKSLESFKNRYSPDKSILLSAQNFEYNHDKRLLKVPLYLAGSI
ncbi:MAG: ATP-binding protein [Candidatus Caenarcaniphilales bacterium]|nr:ATP-binding protein [Candidatus Caenarcaniphilales bacterium]